MFTNTYEYLSSKNVFFSPAIKKILYSKLYLNFDSKSAISCDFQSGSISVYNVHTFNYSYSSVRSYFFQIKKLGRDFPYFAIDPFFKCNKTDGV